MICNDYEFELLRQKTGFDEVDVLANAEVLIITRGELGSSVYTASGARADIPAVPRSASSTRQASVTRSGAGS